LDHSVTIEASLREAILALADEPGLSGECRAAIDAVRGANHIDAVLAAAARFVVLADEAATAAGKIHKTAEAALKHAMLEGGAGEVRSETRTHYVTAVETKTPRRLRLKDASKVPLDMWTDPEPDMKAIERAVKAGQDLGDAVEWEPGKRSVRITATLKKRSVAA
jgi:hypothetical protein